MIGRDNRGHIGTGVRKVVTPVRYGCNAAVHKCHAYASHVSGPCDLEVPGQVSTIYQTTTTTDTTTDASTLMAEGTESFGSASIRHDTTEGEGGGLAEVQLQRPQHPLGCSNPRHGDLLNS